jgi:hypothetical protein
LGFGAGIPGFDDALIPRAVGFLGGGLLLANHFAGSEGGVPDAQARTEVLGIVLAVLGIATPSIEQRLKYVWPALPSPAPRILHRRSGVGSRGNAVMGRVWEETCVRVVGQLSSTMIWAI